MKTRFTTVDIIAIIHELKKYIGYRAIKVYDIDCKTFLIKLSKTGDEGKATLLIESGTRIHTTEFDWPKNPTPSGMSMKLRKHIKNRRLTNVTQIGSDRIVDLQFGSNECSYHFIAELYDRGNLILTDFEYTILHCGRTRVDNVEHKLIAKERYAIEDATVTDYTNDAEMYKAQLKASIADAKPSDNIRKIASLLFVYGPNLLEHCLSKFGYTLNTKLSQALKTASEAEIINNLYESMVNAQNFMKDFQTKDCKGYIYGRRKDENNDDSLIYEDFHPVKFNQMENKLYKEVGSFNEAVDLFFSSIGTQKTELQISQKEKAALKKLENIKSDHEKRLRELHETQELDKAKGEMIENNLDLVNTVIFTLNHAIANQVVWDDIKEMIKEGQKNKDSFVSCITSINLENNKVTLRLQDPYQCEEYSDDEGNVEEEDEANKIKKIGWIDTEIDLSINAYSNARRYFTMKKVASSKEQKTLSSTVKAMKSAEIKTKQMLNDVQTVAKINKARKVNWFEKFNWFISSENYLVVGGKDQSQNELLVKRYMRQGDVYVHADVHGASTVIIQNHKYPQYRDIPPKTLNEAGNMAVVYSGAWASKISSAAWWVYQDQVSKTAPTGEYLTTGSFMIRGKKNYLPVLPLTFGFGIIFKVSDESIQNHIDERKVKGDLEEIVDENIVEEFDEVSSEESDSEFPNTKINPEFLQDATSITISMEEEVANECGDRHKYVSAKKRRDQKKGSDRHNPEFITEERINEEDEVEENCGEEADGVKDQLLGEENLEQIKREQTEDTVEIKLEVKEMKEKVDGNMDAKENESERKEYNAKIKDVEQTKKVKENKSNGKKMEDSEKNEPSGKDVGKSQAPLKRRQANKLKKIKDKYKDQDDEERELKIAILHGKNPYQESEDLKPLTKKEKRKRDEEAKKKSAEEKLLKKPVVPKDHNGARKEKPRDKEALEDIEEDDGGEEVNMASQSQSVLNSLTGMPVAEDELMYALPMCAPYQTLQNYKFKVKMLPGTTKRGKAGKSTLFNFTMDRTLVGGREKELIKAMKDQDITRNFPGTVKMYMPNATRATKKRNNQL